MTENMLSAVKYDAGGVEIKLEPETVKNYLVRGNGKVTDQEVLFFYPDLPGAEVESISVWGSLSDKVWE